ncbi:HpcH/HpaI aldolase family protein [Halarchaeum sp. P4]|uniref:HpcH/HpaI aldolase family protein n=1 Tax=Halarchaeum sp. P4 TaxID=3421639 RepID=UPI003EBCE10F
MTSLRDDFRAREPVVGGWVSVPHPAVAELLGSLTYDFLVLDGEHGEATHQDLADMVRAVDGTRAPTRPLVRVSGADGVELQRVLNLGPAGVMVPEVETAAEAEAVVDACQYRPRGSRGVAGARANDYGADLDRQVTSGTDVAVVVQIETEAGVENADAIAAVEGVDAVFLGPNDLSADLGVYGEYESGVFTAAVEAVVGAGEREETAVGTLAGDPDTVTERQKWGVDFVVAGTDTSMLADGARACLDAANGN